MESINADHEEMKHLKAIVFCRPTEANFARLKKIVDNPKFSEYNLCASLNAHVSLLGALTSPL